MDEVHKNSTALAQIATVVLIIATIVSVALYLTY